MSLLETLNELNHDVATTMINISGQPVADTVMFLAANYITYLIPPLLVLLWFTGGRERYLAFLAFFSVVAGQLIIEFIQFFYHHPRPFVFYETLSVRAPDNSFPSQHAATMFTFAFTLIAEKWKKLGSLFLIFGVINGFARMYLGLHFPLDIVGGILIFIPAYLLVKTLEKYSRLFTDFTTYAEKKLVGFTGLEQPYNDFKQWLRTNF